MIFKCKSCGYLNNINSEFECEACGRSIDEMYFYDVDTYLKELENKYPEKLMPEPRLVRIYFSDYNSPIYKEFKEKYQLDKIIDTLRLGFFHYLDYMLNTEEHKKLFSTLLKYDESLPDYLYSLDTNTLYILLDKGRNYLDYDAYKILLQGFAKKVGKDIGVDEVVPIIEERKWDDENNRTLGTSHTEKVFYLNGDYVSDVFNKKESPLNLIFTIAHELCHCYIKDCLLNGRIDKELAQNMEHCIEEACRILCKDYDYNGIYKDDNYSLNYEENTANLFAFRYVNNIIRSLGNIISENDKNRYLNTVYMDTIERYGAVNGIFNFELGIPKFVDDFGLYESANKDESVELNGEKFLKNNRDIVYTHELLDTMIQENPDILEVKMFKLLNIIYVNDNGAVRRKTVEELQSDLNKTDNPYLKQYLADQIKDLEEIKSSYKK